MGIPQALLTVGSDNEASNRVIESNGGVIEDERIGHSYRCCCIDLGR